MLKFLCVKEKKSESSSIKTPKIHLYARVFDHFCLSIFHVIIVHVVSINITPPNNHVTLYCLIDKHGSI